jgi:hypothetical protein
VPRILLNAMHVHISVHMRMIMPSSPPDRISLCKDVLRHELEKKQDSESILVELDGASSGAAIWDLSIKVWDMAGEVHQTELASVILYLLGPDPLETLCRRVVGLPDYLN